MLLQFFNISQNSILSIYKLLDKYENKNHIIKI